MVVQASRGQYLLGLPPPYLEICPYQPTFEDQPARATPAAAISLQTLPLKCIYLGRLSQQPTLSNGLFMCTHQYLSEQTDIHHLHVWMVATYRWIPIQAFETPRCY